MGFFDSLLGKKNNNTTPPPLEESLHRCKMLRDAGGTLEEGLPLVRQLLHHYPDDARVQYEAAACHDAIGDFDTAEHHFNRSLELDAQNPITYLSRGYLYLHQQRFAEARSDWEKAAELDEKLASKARYLVGMAYQEEGNDTAAEEAFVSVIEAEPDNFLASYNLACLLNHRHAFTEALPLWNKLIEQSDTFSDAYFNRGFANFNLKNYDEAIADFDFLIEHEAAPPDALFFRGACFEALGDLDAARDDWQRAADYGYDDANDKLNALT